MTPTPKKKIFRHPPTLFIQFNHFNVCIFLYKIILKDAIF